MVCAGYRIFDADSHILEPVEPVEEYLTAVSRRVVMHRLQRLPPS